MTSRTIHGSGSAARCFREGAVAALVLSCGLAFAAGPAPAVRFHLDQPPQGMAESLREIARQTGASVLFDPAKVSGRTAKAVSGQLTAAEAISQALNGSGLEAIVMPDGSIVIRPIAAPSATSASAPHSGGGAEGSSDRNSAKDESPGRRVPGATGAVIAADPAGDSDPAGTVTSLDKVEVTGSRLKRIDSEGPAPVNVYTRKDIERSGQPTLERFLSSLNEASVSSGEGGLGQTTGQGTVQLRGLPLGSTLVLINGRRVQAVGSSSGDYFNLNLIPMAAIERVEIVPVGSSAVYGGDALAGVVNIILKKSIEGVVLDARLASAAGTGDGGISLGTGGHSDAGSFLLLGSYSKTTPLTAADRSFFQDADYRRFGGVDARTRSCTPGTVSSTSSANLPGLSATFAGIPAGAGGQMLTAANFGATAGLANLCDPLADGHGTALIYGTESFALHATGERRLGQAWTAFGELSFDRDLMSAEQGGFQLNNVLVPATNPYNPFGTAVRVTERLGLENGAETFTRDTDFKRILAGLRGDLAAGWDTEVAVSSTRDDGQRLINTTANTAALNAALGATSAASALNPFTSGIAGSEAVVQSIWPDTPRMNHGRKDEASAFVRGPLLTLPAGTVDVIAGAEMAHDHYQTVTPGSFDIEASRSSDAVYGEVRVPLWRSTGRLGAGADVGADAGATDGAAGDAATDAATDAAKGSATGSGREIAALTLAGRRDHYSDFGSANTYQAGLEFRPVKTLLMRGSAATSFKPPTLLQTHVDELTYTTESYGLVDPERGNAPIVGGEVLRATNPNLHPETGQAYSLGAVWEPESAVGTRLAVTAWRVKIDGLIALLWPQVVLDNESLFPELITRAPSSGGVPGQVTNVLYTEVNFGGVSTSGIDMELAHDWKTADGKWTASASATRTTSYDVTLTPGAPIDDRLGHRAADFWSPKWKGRLSLGFDRGPWSVGLTSRYLGSYEDMAPSTRSLGNYWIHDLAASFNLRKMGVTVPGAKEASLSLAIANLANRMPEYVSTYPYYDVTQGDWRGRYATARLSVNW